jgi:hypothetical protein
MIKQDINNDRLIFVVEDNSIDEFLQNTFSSCAIQLKSSLDLNELHQFKFC